MHRLTQNRDFLPIVSVKLINACHIISYQYTLSTTEYKAEKSMYTESVTTIYYCKKVTSGYPISCCWLPFGASSHTLRTFVGEALHPTFLMAMRKYPSLLCYYSEVHVVYFGTGQMCVRKVTCSDTNQIDHSSTVQSVGSWVLDFQTQSTF